MNDGPAIHDVLLTDLFRFEDDRGTVLHHLRNDDPTFTGFGECYFSEVVAGAVKAWKRHRHQTQHLAVPVGRVRFVVYDDRQSSPTRGSLDVVDLGRPDAYRRLRIPAGLWYGFQCLGDRDALIANCADVPHDPDDNEIVEPEDSPIPYAW
ncbi:MAG: dTDP-4-dehydrorhamnose 3,5-epimerase family protein [Actinomycetota bacterium]|nr:dTDP-4-dehydrorhamnose 3,5-epimerase family protein [Actinomycetota bacterium]MED6327476.1 dTDP-4-dehydrorhamnose 3,5-epimerase family protein [Actinomycetota bacterium]MEE2958714.1 dTDP-4-dehydrorhamnose 3,5-epimerase family protein [Actinomycetota bacterium]